MSKRIDKISIIDKNIFRNIELISKENRGFFSQNILSELRNLIEQINLFFYEQYIKKDIDDTYDNIQSANAYIKSRGQFRLLARFHDFLQIVASHYTQTEEVSERLMLKYYEYLLKLKILMKQFNINILNNIENFPLYNDSNLKQYYEQIALKLETQFHKLTTDEYNDRYYIQKIKPFFVKEQIYYEITFFPANDHDTKVNRIIAFTKLDILQNYAVKFSIREENIEAIGKIMPILIIDDYKVAIRACEINNFAKILFDNFKGIYTSSKDYKNLMKILMEEHINLLEIILSDDIYYSSLRSYIQGELEESLIIDILDKCRNIVLNKYAGANIIRYLLYSLTNKIIKLQFYNNSCSILSNLNLSYGTKPFDDIPFNTSLVYHNPSIYELLNCIDVIGREDEFLARKIKNNSEQEGCLYTNKKELEKTFKDIDNLISKYNDKIYCKHKPKRNIEEHNSHLYINEYENNTYHIIKKIKEFSKKKIEGYSSSTEIWLKEKKHNIDCEEKKKYLIRMFEKSAVALIYGSAGTGKTTLINHISERFPNVNKLYLANTNPAINNLKRKIKSQQKSKFFTISKFLSNATFEEEYDILFIDECSTVSNMDMLSILNKVKTKLLVLVGDIFQIESIVFGNWFYIAKSLIPEQSIFELKKPYRSENNNLVKFWDSVRNMEDDILEVMTKNNYTHSLDESIFKKEEDDEIILCLNYDGLYGINNINKFLQKSNNNHGVLWEGQIYKEGDPILFNNVTNRFGGLIYNNLKGKIIKIYKEKLKISFDIEIEEFIDKMEANFNNFNVVSNNGNKTIVNFYVNKIKDSDEDNSSYQDNVVPFQIAYAVSIHKSQGLEYDSVKIIITDELEEQITHNIFYTAITRARKNLKIYWSPGTENKILKSFKKRENNKDIYLLLSKYKDLEEK